MGKNIIQNMQEELLKELVKNIEDPFKIITVKEVAKDLYIGENKANEIFNRVDFPSNNIGKKRKVANISYIMWKLERREEIK